MRVFKLTLAALALLCFAVSACNSGGGANNQQAANTNARPAATASSTPATASTPDELAQAATDYKNACVNCHKADGSGGPFKLEDKEMKVPDLRTHGLKDKDSELAEQIAEGGDDMPPFKKKFDAARIDNLVRYIRREFHHQTPAAAAPGNVNAPAQPAH